MACMQRFYISVCLSVRAIRVLSLSITTFDLLEGDLSSFLCTTNVTIFQVLENICQKHVDTGKVLL